MKRISLEELGKILNEEDKKQQQALQNIRMNVEEDRNTRSKKKHGKIRRFFRKIVFFFRGIDERFIKNDYNEEIEQFKYTQQTQYSMLMDYAHQIKLDREKIVELKKQYIYYINSNNFSKRLEIKNALLNAQNDLHLAKSFMKSKINEIKRNENLSYKEKQEILDEIYEISGMKRKQGPAHMKKVEPSKTKSNKIDELKVTEERLNASRHFTNEQKKKMLEELKQEILSLTQKETIEPKTKKLDRV